MTEYNDFRKVIKALYTLNPETNDDDFYKLYQEIKSVLIKKYHLPKQEFSEFIFGLQDYNYKARYLYKRLSDMIFPLQ